MVRRSPHRDGVEWPDKDLHVIHHEYIEEVLDSSDEWKETWKDLRKSVLKWAVIALLGSLAGVTWWAIKTWLGK